MAIVVTKFGGSSVKNPERIKAVAERLVALYNEGNQVVAVVSAMGKTTDALVDLAAQITAQPSSREMDMLLTTGEQVSMALLAMAIQACGVQAVSHTGGQVGIITDSVHTKAKISEIRAHQIQDDLARGQIVVVAGFQGINAKGDPTTLGRGGSDTTAVAIAAALKADRCEIYSDVDGVYTADPRVVSVAHKIDALSYEEMLELSSAGAGVLHMRAVEFARNFGVRIHARSSYTDTDGTFIKEADPAMETAVISGIAHDLSEAKVTVRHLPDSPGIAARLFELLADASVNVDMIIQDIAHDGVTDLSFTTPVADLQRAGDVVEAALVEMGAEGISIDDNIAKISLIGAGMKTHPGVAAKMFKTLSEVGANIMMISTSPIRISTIIQKDRYAEAVRALHTAFNLDTDCSIEEVQSSGLAQSLAADETGM